MDGKAGRNLRVSVVEFHPSGVDVAHHRNDFVGFVGMREVLNGHVATRGVRHLAILQMKAGAREQIEIPDVVVVKMGDDNIFHAGGVDSQQFQSIDRRAQEIPAATACRGFVETRVDDNRSLRTPGEPDEVVHALTRFVWISANEILRLSSRDGGVLDRVDLEGKKLRGFCRIHRGLSNGQVVRRIMNANASYPGGLSIATRSATMRSAGPSGVAMFPTRRKPAFS